VKIYKKGRKRALDLVRNKKKDALKEEEQRGMVYSVPCMKCEAVYIGETKKKLQERLKQHKDDLRLKRDRNAIYKHVQEEAHDIDWKGTEVLERSERRVRETGDKAMNWHGGLRINEEWEDILGREDRRKSSRK